MPLFEMIAWFWGASAYSRIFFSRRTTEPKRDVVAFEVGSWLVPAAPSFKQQKRNGGAEEANEEMEKK